jgi:NAD(P)-dependent dehydrogenase (short-subunit alcohol dehydrogenase family)
MKLQGKVALITGAGSGIGRATAILFAEEGAKVTVNDFVPSSGNETVRMINESGGEAIFSDGDVSNASDAKGIVKKAIEKYGRLDILFNNAGVGTEGTVTTTSEREWDRIIDTNLKGIFLISKHAIPAMQEIGKGVIINMASALGFVGRENLSAYVASKGGVIALTRAMALDYAPKIRINCLCPGAISTPMIEEAFSSSPDPEAMRRDYISLQPIGRLGTPKDVANAALYLASEEASFITGSALTIDGGLTSH